MFLREPLHAVLAPIYVYCVYYVDKLRSTHETHICSPLSLSYSHAKILLTHTYARTHTHTHTCSHSNAPAAAVMISRKAIFMAKRTGANSFSLRTDCSILFARSRCGFASA